MGIFGKNKGLSDEEELNILTRFSLEKTCNKIMEEIPQQGSFTPVVHFFDIPGTRNSAQIVVVHHANSPAGERSLQLRVGRMGDNCCHSYFLKTGTNEELRDYLKREDTAAEWAGYIKELSDKIQRSDDYELG